MSTHTFLTAILTGVLLILGCAHPKEVLSADFSYDTYANVLKTYVNEEGLVDYEGLKGNRTELDRFVRLMESLDPKIYQAWTSEEKMAFWINAYNALTLKAVVDHYPVKSIKDIGNIVRSVWDKLKFDVMGNAYTLNDIEHRILRKDFNEPYIHMAINCASGGCPPLRNEPFTGDRLKQQFEEQTRQFLSNPEKFRIDGTTVYLSPIFKWFGEDFTKIYKRGANRPGNKVEQSVIEFIRLNVQPGVAARLANKDLRVKYLDYDWSLNKQR